MPRKNRADAPVTFEGYFRFHATDGTSIEEEAAELAGKPRFVMKPWKGRIPDPKTADEDAQGSA